MESPLLLLNGVGANDDDDIGCDALADEWRLRLVFRLELE